jgi:adenylate cyclase
MRLSDDPEEVRFGRFQFSLRRRRLLHNGEPVELAGRALDVLGVLASAEGAVVSKDELMARLWPGRTVAENNLHVHVSALRKALDEHGEGDTHVITVPGRGYRLAGFQLTASNELASALDLPLPDKPSIAVLPFANLSADAEYFADGLTEDIITALSRITSMAVIARNSAFVYKGKPADVKQVGSDLGARYVLEGSVRCAGQRVRVTAQLVDTATGNHLWAEKYDRELADIFAIQDEITRCVVGSAQTQVLLSEGALAERSARPDFQSWDLAKRGWKKVYELTHESLEAAREIARELVRIDPLFAKGHQVLAAAGYHQALMGFSNCQDTLLWRALRSAQEAVRLEEGDEYSHWLLGGILGQGLGYHDKAVAAYQRALELNPNFSVAYGSLGTVLALAGRPDESIRNSEICIRSNPRDPSVFFRFSGLSLAYFVGQDYGNARECADRAVARKSSWWQGPALLAVSCAFLGNEEEAHAAVRDLLLVLPAARISNLPPIPFKNADDAGRFREGLRKAGLPE